MIEDTMQTSAVMNNDPFDMLTASLDSTVSLWQRLHLIVAFLASQLMPFFGGPPPNAMPASAIRPCLPVNDDGLCGAGEKTRLSGFTPSVNGCGSASGTKFPNGYGAGNWLWACDKHDGCYTDCATPRATCDSQIEEDILSTCRAGYPGFGNILKRLICFDIAHAYFIAIRLGGTNPWIQGQKEGCRCCANCESGLRACGTQCCNDSEVCCAGQCIDPGRRCCLSTSGEYICGAEQRCCGLSGCCDPGSTCCERDGMRSCIPFGDQNCDLQCRPCASNEHCCLSASGTSSYGCCLPTQKCDPDHGCIGIS
jgi:hypothetical protein